MRSPGGILAAVEDVEILGGRLPAAGRLLRPGAGSGRHALVHLAVHQEVPGLAGAEVDDPAGQSLDDLGSGLVVLARVQLQHRHTHHTASMLSTAAEIALCNFIFFF